jgi:hypothetical protein
VNFELNEVVPIVFQFYQSPQFDIHDPGSITFLNEAAALLFTLHTNYDEFDAYVLELKIDC